MTSLVDSDNSLTSSLEITIAQLEQHLSQQGHFCLIDWFIDQNILSYSDYEAWRHQRVDYIDQRLAIDSEALQILFVESVTFCKQLNLVVEAQTWFSWSDRRHRLKASRNEVSNTLLTQHWQRAQDCPQLDLFMDNSAVITENEVHHALASRQFDQAQKKLQHLTRINPKHVRLGVYQDLINYGAHAYEARGIAEDALLVEIQGLSEEVEPLAKETLGTLARDYLGFAWRRIGAAMTELPYNAEQEQLHTSYALVQIPDWHGARDSLLAAPQNLDEPSLLHRLALCFEHCHQKSEALLAWCILMERDAVYGEAKLEEQSSALLWPFWQDFWELNDGGQASFFSAYLVARQPSITQHQDKLPPLTAASTKAMVTLIAKHLFGDDEMQEREQLQAISPALLRLYLHVRA